MNSIPSPLDRPASIPILRRLLAAKVIAPAECQSLEQQIRRDLPWKQWLDRGLLTLGVVLILAGIGYFFAHNWNHLTDNDKLGLAGGAVLASFIGATWAGFDRFSGKLLLLAASMLVGVYIAVFGQIYQTGADSYELFTAWAFLIFPWVALGRFIPLWLCWIGLLNFALGFYWPVAPFLDLSESWTMFRHETISLLLLNLMALLLREGAGRWPISWLDRGWSNLILLTAVTIPATVETAGEILHTWDYQANNNNACLAFVLYAAFVTGLGFYYSRVRYSLPSLALITLSTCTVLTILATRFIVNDHSDNNSGIWLVMGVVVLAIFGGGVYFLRTQRLSHQS